jgi:hypothetical protein
MTVGAICGLAFAALVAADTQAQILRPAGPLVGGLGETVGQTVERVPDVLDRTTNSLVSVVGDPQSLVRARATRLGDFLQRNHRTVERDEVGDPVVRGEVLAMSPNDASLAAAAAAGFSVVRRETLAELGVDVAVLAPPPHTSVRQAMRLLRKVDPTGTYDFDHLYFSAGGAGSRGQLAVRPMHSTTASGGPIGLIDTGVAAKLPVFSGARIEQKGFAPGAPAPAAHGTATASLIGGRLASFRGADPGASLLAADVYGTTGAGGSAEAIAKALAWLVGAHARVINISLVGPPNALLGASVAAARARGAWLVAAVGDDGPAAPPAYPASYPDVIAVTGVDRHDRVLPEAGGALHVDFAAPAADLKAATLRGGLGLVRGTSFAAPIVAGRLAEILTGASGDPRAVLAREARPAGPRSGGGVIGDDVRLLSAAASAAGRSAPAPVRF